MSDFIDDGYTNEFTIEAEANINEELTITYRPALPEQKAMLMEVNADEKESVYIARAIDMLGREKTGLLLGWTLKDRKGEIVKITRENVAKVRDMLLRKIIGRVFYGPAVEAAVKN